MGIAIKPGFVASLAIHVAALLAAAWTTAPAFEDDEETLVVEYSGVEADEQVEEKLKAQTIGSPGSKAVSAQQQTLKQAGDDRHPDATPDDPEPTPSAEQPPAASANAVAGSPGSLEVTGADQWQKAQKIRPRDENHIDAMRAYAKLLTKKVQSKLVYPDSGRQAGLQGAAVVSFTILQDGALRTNSLRLVSSSGEAKLDESALKTIQACAPFDPPQREITLKITIRYGPMRGSGQLKAK